jgi:hypothetical protein
MKKILIFCSIFFQNQIAFTQQVSGFQEVVFRVRELDSHIKFYNDVAGYILKFRGKVHKSVNRLWNLDENVDLEEAFLINSDDSTGFVRLVSIKNLHNQQLMRPSLQSWDSGGIFDLDVRVTDVEKISQKMVEYGWLPTSLPHRYQFGKF